MKKFLIVAFVLSLMAVSAFSTETRTMTMGQNGTVLVDDANQFSFYGRTYNYPNIAVGEFTEPASFGMFGINWKFGTDKPWVLGTYFSTSAFDDALSFGDPGMPMVAWDNTLPPNRRIALLYGRELGTVNFGFGFQYTHSSFQSEAAADQTEESFGTMKFGVGLTDIKGKWDVAADFSLGTLTDINDLGVVQTDKDGWTDFGIRGRYFYEYNPNLTFVPHAEATFGTHSVIYDPAVTNTKWKSTGSDVEFGVGINMTPANNVLAVGDLGVLFGTNKDANTDAGGVTTEDKWTTSTIPYWKIGMEADVFKWMDIRMGATSDWHTIKHENIEKYSGAYNDTYLGFGFHFGRLHVDTYTDPQVFLNGFDFVAGNGPGDMNMSISALYEMF